MIKMSEDDFEKLQRVAESRNDVLVDLAIDHSDRVYIETLSSVEKDEFIFYL